eukprot:CAMPEP_0182430790 /NCGR_PEP_ID=MMETSP1167-20130531/43374_1 /TAXON_ID=2988 /ORGANISM="Mallomonas Sp, Strain CCMP3275" /LENGTH=166 /DNA_ID=CAMNT_0024616271 /DNA_START=81 /DNA_END=581 /DNA_ORIENTATION=-
MSHILKFARLASPKHSILITRLLTVALPKDVELTPEKVKQVKNTDLKLRLQHLAFESELEPKLRDEVRRRRMIYRSKQRGWLEVDLLMGSWAAENVPLLTEEELDQYDAILEEETIDIFNYMSGQQPLPSHLAELPLMEKLRKYSYAKNIKGPMNYRSVKEEANLT